MKLNKLVGPITGVFTLVCATLTSHAVDFHVTSAQELQTALTLAAANGANNNIYLAAGYYTGNFNFNSAQNMPLIIQGEPGTTNTQITIDGAGTGRDLNLVNTGTGNFTVRGITFLRNTGNSDYGTLRVAGGPTSSILVDTCRFITTSGTGKGLELVSGATASITNCIILGKNDGSRGIDLQLGTTISGCVVSSNGGEGIYLYSSSGLTLIGNTIVGNGFSGSKSSGVNGGGGYCTVKHNYIAGNGADGMYGGGWYENNVFKGNGGSGLMRNFTQ